MRADEAASVGPPGQDRSLTPEFLRQRWHKEAEEVGLPTGSALLHAVRENGMPLAAIGRAEVRGCSTGWSTPRWACAPTTPASAKRRWSRRWRPGQRATFRLRRSKRSPPTGSCTPTGWSRLLNVDTSGRAPGRSTTVGHRRLEDRVLHRLALVQQRQVAAIDPAVVGAAVASASRLGDDQAAAVDTLCAGGPALRALISPAGYGKTTTLATAVEAARQAGHPVLAVSTTNQAVDQLRQVGIPAITVARFGLDGLALPPGTVVVVDEFSQLPTSEADTVLAAAASCPEAMVWLVGDPLQAQPVGAGGLAHWIAEQARKETVPVAELTVNRRQVDPTERQALRRFRHGDIAQSQQLRDDAGWEHHHADRDQALSAMAAAVLAAWMCMGPIEWPSPSATPTAKRWPIASGAT